MNQDRAKRKLTAIFSADVVGYSRLMEADEEWTIKSLEENKRLIGELVEEYKGRVVDAIGDNLLAEFSSVTNAVECAVKIQQELKNKNANFIEERRMEFRIGVNLGEVVEEGGRIYGSGVNIAARLEGLTQPGGICISGRTYDHIKTKLGLGYKYLGEHNVKNISEPIRIYRLLMDSVTAGKVIDEKRFLGRISRRVAMTTIIVLAIIAAGSISWIIYSHQSEKIETAVIEPGQAPIVFDVEEAPKTIAVIPFVNLSPDPDQEYFVDGLSEELLNSLTKIPDLLVTARTSSFAFKGTDKKVQEIASELGVAHILEGSVRKADNVLRITAQLIRASDGFHLWSETYNRELEDIFAVQEDIATSVADELKITLGIDQSLQSLGVTENVEAYEHFLVAKGQMSDIFEVEIGEDTSAKTSRAQESLDAAIALDPEFALAWTFKAIIHWYHLLFTPSYRLDSAIDRGLNAALRAIELEPNLAEAYYSLGLSRFLRSEYIEAELAYRKAMELAYDPINCYQFGFPVFSLSVGSYERANEIIEASRQIDPLNETIYGVSVLVSSLIGDVQLAEEKYKRGKEIFGDQWELGDGFITTLRLGVKDVVSRDDIVQSGRIWDEAKEHLDSPEEGLAELRRLYSSDDNPDTASLSFISSWAAYFGDPEFAMEAIEKASRIEASTQYFIWFPIMKEVRKLPRFKEWVREIGLVDYWKEYGWPDLCHPVGDNDFVCD